MGVPATAGAGGILKRQPSRGCGYPGQPPVTLSDDLSVRAASPKRRLDVPWPRLDATARQASPVWVPVGLAAVVVLGFATWSLASGDFGWRDAVGVLALLAAAAIAEAFPVPIEGVAVGGTSVATIFLVAVAVVY